MAVLGGTREMGNGFRTSAEISVISPKRSFTPAGVPVKIALVLKSGVRPVL